MADRLIAVLVLLVLALPAFSLDVEYLLEAGWTPNGGFGGREGEHVSFYDPSNQLYIQLGLRLLPVPWLYFGGSVTIQMSLMTEREYPVFDPTFTNYGVEGGLRLGPLVVFFSHDCTHHQVTGTYAYRITSLWGEGGVSRVGVRVSNGGGKW